MNHKGVKCYIQLEKLPALSFTHKQPGQWAVKLSMNENGHHLLSKYYFHYQNLFSLFEELKLD